MLRIILCILLTFQQLFSVDFVFFPIRTRTITAVIGLFLFFKDWRTFKVPQRYIKLILQFFLAVFSLLIIAVFSSLINNNFDPYFYKFPIVLIISFASSYCYIKWLAAISKKELTTELLIKYFVGATLLQCFLSLLVFLIPAFRNFIFTIVPMTEMNEEAVYLNIHPHEDVLFRMIPVGYDFWGIGTTLTIIIFLMAILANQEKSRRDFIYILLSLVFIVVIGASISRTTLVGALFFLLYLLFCKGERRNKKYLLRMIIVFIPIVVIAYTLFLESYPIFDIVFERAFSVFYSFKETGEMQSVESMVGKAVIPTEFRTWIIGDGLMADPLYPGTKFYKGVDIGNWRMIFGIGVLGLFVFSFIQYMFCKLAGFRKWEMLFLLLIYCAFMYKGIFYYDLLMSPFIMMILYNSRIKRKKTILANG